MGIAETIAREENDKLRSKIAALVSEAEGLRAERDEYKKALEYVKTNATDHNTRFAATKALSKHSR